MMMVNMLFFFFSSRRRHTRFDCDWSSDVCSSDLGEHGKLLWDNSFEINDVRTFTLEQFVKMDAQKEKIALLYLYDNKIRTKIIQDSIVLEGKTSKQLQPKADASPGSSINRLDYWYDDYFLAYGVQDIGSPTLLGRNRKKVFFVSKVSYD